MVLKNIGDCHTIDEYVAKKMDLLSKTDKSFCSLYKLMFSQTENTMAETTDGNRIICQTYGDCEKEITNKSKKLKTVIGNLPKPAIVGLYMGNSPEWIQLFWAILRNGCTPLLMNTRLDDERLNNVIRQYGVELVISDGKAFSVRTVKADEIEKADSFEDYRDDWANEIIVMSSGTGAMVKLCVYNGENFCCQVNDSVKIITECAQMKKHYEGSLKLLAFLPFYHIFGLAAVYMWFGFFSRSFVFLRDINPETIQNTVKKHKVTHIFAVPLFWNRIYDEAMRKIAEKGEKTYAQFTKALEVSLKLGNGAVGSAFARKAFFEIRRNIFGESVCFLITGGSSVSQEVLSFFNGIGYHLANGYGMSETGITSVELSNKTGVLCSRSVGKPFFSVEYDINENGELMVKSKSSACRILQDGKVIFEGGNWFCTHDIAKCEKGRYYILGRTDDMIVCRDGENINPDWVEESIKVAGANGVCLVKRCDASGSPSPVLVVSVNRYLTSDRMRAVIKSAGDGLMKLGLSAEIVLTTDLFIKPNEFKLNRRRISRELQDGTMKIVTPDTALGGEKISSELLAAVKNIFAEALSKNAADIGQDEHFFFDLGGTSLDYLSLMAQISKEFSLTLPSESGGGLFTVRDFCMYIQENIK